MALDLLWSVLTQAQQQQQQEQQQWSLVRVAIVDLRDGVFIGRLFFGDSETGAVAWDVDCRRVSAPGHSQRRGRAVPN